MDTRKIDFSKLETATDFAQVYAGYAKARASVGEDVNVVALLSISKKECEKAIAEIDRICAEIEADPSVDLQEWRRD